MAKKILFITTNFSNIDDDIRTGVDMEEFSVPYLVFQATGYEITIASPCGGNSPIDEGSLSCSNPMEWDEPAKLLKNTVKLDEIDYSTFDALYIPGGHGCMFDLSKCEKLKEIVEYFYNSKRIIASICHGVVGLVLARDKNDNPIVKNKHLTSITNKEEHILKMEEFMPFLLQSKLMELGADFVEEKPWSEHVEICGNLITGQNNKSTLLLAESVVSLL